MNTRIEELTIGGATYYIGRFRKHWFSPWRYVKNLKTGVPQLFVSPKDALYHASMKQNYYPKDFFD